MKSRLMHAMIWILATISCSQLDKEQDSSPNDVDIGSSLTYSGYVQRAFNITVNSVGFSDTEDFYTRFIPELILAKEEYKSAFADAEITIEGEYAIDRFGSNSMVYLSSMSADGHLFQARTDSQGKFTIQATVAAQDEVFKARVIMKIGLLISRNEVEPEHFCYILHGYREDIRITETSKPIIFDSFNTQLNSYNCSDVKESELLIPGGSASASTPNGDVPADDTKVITSPDGTTKVEPHIKVTNVVRVSSPLSAGESGPNELTSITYDPAEGSFLLAKSRIRNQATGLYSIPVLKITNMTEPAVTHWKIDESTEESGKGQVVALLPYEKKILFLQGSHLLSFNPLDSTAEDIFQNSRNNTYTSGSLFYWDATIKRLTPWGICNADEEETSLDTSCLHMVDIPESVQPERSYQKFLGATLHDDMILMNFGDQQYNGNSFKNKIVAINRSAVYLKHFTISKLTIPTHDLNTGRIVSDTENLWFVTLSKDELTFRKIELVE